MIHKYLINPFYVVLMKRGARPLSVAFQKNNLCVWALVDENEDDVEHKFFTYSTGEDIPLPQLEATFMGTAFLDDMVFHVFYKGEV